MAYGKGYLRDLPHKRTQRDSRRLFGASPPVPPAASLEPHELPIFDQGQSSSCTGHGLSQSIWTAICYVGPALAFVPSPRGIYTLARCIGRVQGPGGALPPLEDHGAMPADAMSGLSAWGIHAMGPKAADGRNSDVDPTTVNREPEFEELEIDALHIVSDEYRIDESSADVVAQTCAAIAAGSPVGVGFFCDSRFEDWYPALGPAPAPDLNDSAGGGHWMSIHGYATAPDGTKVFRGPNSWGEGWGDHGHFVASEAWLRAAFDLYVMRVQVRDP